MCGIIGTFCPFSDPELDGRLDAGLGALRHRGPDDCGLERFTLPYGALALGHTRLSIIDLSPGGHQPMRSADGRYWIVFNGEIYNYKELRKELTALGHRFRSESDTEVLLETWVRWGVDCLPRLIGMFAFAVYDSHDQTLTLARDPFGIKPLFYSNSPDCFAFASEVPALLALKDSCPLLDWQRSYDYLAFGDYDTDEGTFIKGVLHLPPGHVCTLDLQTSVLSTPAPWFQPCVEQTSRMSFSEAADRLRDLFLESIRLHLRSDVPLGVGLSGGIDSSAVVGCIRKLEPRIPIHTFSFVARGSDVSEEEWVDKVNRYVGARPHKVFVSADDLVQDLDDVIRTQGEPFGTTSIYAQYRVYKMAREHGVVVVLDGQGADELLAGYQGYPGHRMRSLIESREFVRAWRFVHEWSQWPGRNRWVPWLSYGSQIAPRWAIGAARRLKGRNERSSWLKTGVLREAGVRLEWPRTTMRGNAARRRLSEALANDAFRKGLPPLLRHGDRNSMRFSLESRVPFLTLPLAQFVLSLPESYLISDEGETKSVFRKAMRGIVPDATLDRKDKIGFATPELDWLTAIAGRIRAWLCEPVDIPFLDQGAIVSFYDEVISRKRPFTFQVWRWLNFIRWVTLTGVR